MGSVGTKTWKEIKRIPSNVKVSSGGKGSPGSQSSGGNSMTSSTSQTGTMEGGATGAGAGGSQLSGGVNSVVAIASIPKVISEISKPNKPTIITEQGTGEPTPTTGPSDAEVAKAAADDAALQSQLESSRRKGRASTQLSSPEGLGGSTRTSSKRTLLGA